MYRVVIMDWFSRYVLTWELSNTLDRLFCLDALETALTISRPDIFNSGHYQPLATEVRPRAEMTHHLCPNHFAITLSVPSCFRHFVVLTLGSSILCHRTLDALAQVHHTLGIGFLHQVYRRAARVELAARYIEHDYLKELPLSYKGHVIKMTPTRLLLVENKLLLATVAMQAIPTSASERLRWAMNVTGARLGLIVNFYGTRLGLQFVRQG